MYFHKRSRVIIYYFIMFSSNFSGTPLLERILSVRVLGKTKVWRFRCFRSIDKKRHFNCNLYKNLRTSKRGPLILTYKHINPHLLHFDLPYILPRFSCIKYINNEINKDDFIYVHWKYPANPVFSDNWVLEEANIAILAQMQHFR